MKPLSLPSTLCVANTTSSQAIALSVHGGVGSCRLEGRLRFNWWLLLLLLILGSSRTICSILWLVALSGRTWIAQGRFGIVRWLSSWSVPSTSTLNTRITLSSVTATACCWSADTVISMMLPDDGGVAPLFNFLAGRSPSFGSPSLVTFACTCVLVACSLTGSTSLKPSSAMKLQRHSGSWGGDHSQLPCSAFVTEARHCESCSGDDDVPYRQAGTRSTEAVLMMRLKFSGIVNQSPVASEAEHLPLPTLGKSRFTWFCRIGWGDYQSLSTAWAVTSGKREFKVDCFAECHRLPLRSCRIECASEVDWTPARCAPKSFAAAFQLASENLTLSVTLTPTSSLY
ncbi:hypothetical protein KC323_g162 [Hortaea werneckii]|nr:hypothetical protein KC323_g162 [Hortaea werneckii]